MKGLKIVALFVLVSLLLVAVVGCGSAPAPVTMSSIPTYTTAKVATDSAFTAVGDSITTGLKNQFGDKVSNVDNAIYMAGANTKWEDVQKFYSDALTKSDWKTDPSYNYTGNGASGQAWSRGTQVLYVILVPVPAMNDSVLAVSLISVKQ